MHIIKHMKVENGKVEFIAKVTYRGSIVRGKKYKYPVITIPKEVRQYVQFSKHYKIIMIPLE